MNAANHAAKYQQQFLRFWLNIRWLEYFPVQESTLTARYCKVSAGLELSWSGSLISAVMTDYPLLMPGFC